MGGYPKVGEHIMAEVNYKGHHYFVEGILQNVFRTRSGAVIGVVLTPDGRKVSVPWSKKYTTFF